MARLPSNLTYNDMTGAEWTEVAVDWFRRLLQQQPWAQPHITLPNAKMTLDCHVAIDMWPGGTVPVASPPERLDIAGAVTVENVVGATGATGALEHSETDLHAVVSAAPQPGGSPPDMIREAHGLPIPVPGYGPRDTGSHLFLHDVMVETERRGTPAEGYTFAAEPVPPPVNVTGQEIPVERGAITLRADGEPLRHESGMQVTAGKHIASVKTFGDERGAAYGSVNGVYDAGPAGLMSGRGGGGLYSDGRSRLSFGNNNKG